MTTKMTLPTRLGVQFSICQPWRASGAAWLVAVFVLMPSNATGQTFKNEHRAGAQVRFYQPPAPMPRKLAPRRAPAQQVAAQQPLQPRRVTCDDVQPARPITELGTQIQPPAGELPIDCASFYVDSQQNGDLASSRAWSPTLLYWTPPLMCHKPLYFEELALERFGHTRLGPLQPAVSGVHFFGNVAALPVRAIAQPPRTCIYDLGYERPGNYMPNICKRLPLPCAKTCNVCYEEDSQECVDCNQFAQAPYYEPLP